MKNFKKIFAIAMVILTVATSMVACSTNTAEKAVNDVLDNVTVTVQTKETQPAKTEAPTEAAKTEAPTEKATEAPTEAPTEKATEAPVIATEAPVVENTNYFFNDTNNVYDDNSLSIKPRYVYWDGGKLVAECFVINGYGHTVYDINVKSLAFANQNGDIASASFGSMDGVTIAPYSHVIWTFTFGEDCVVSPGADLSSLRYKSNTTNSY